MSNLSKFLKLQEKNEIDIPQKSERKSIKVKDLKRIPDNLRDK